MPLTDTAIKKVKPGPSPAKLSDGKGMYLLVTESGSKLWRWKYRADGKEKVMALGSYPDVPLSQAREAMGNARKLLATGSDPMAQRKADKLAKQSAAENSFQTVALLWWDQWRSAKSPRHADDVHKRLKADVFPAIGKRPISDIQAPELVAMVKAIAGRGALDIAKRALQTSGQVFRYAIAHGLAQRNPATDIKPADILASRKAANYARLACAKYLKPMGWRSHDTVSRALTEIKDAGLLIETRMGMRPNRAAWFALGWYALDVTDGIDLDPKTYRTGQYRIATLNPKVGVERV